MAKRDTSAFAGCERDRPTQAGSGRIGNQSLTGNRTACIRSQSDRAACKQVGRVDEIGGPALGEYVDPVGRVGVNVVVEGRFADADAAQLVRRKVRLNQESRWGPSSLSGSGTL